MSVKDEVAAGLAEVRGTDCETASARAIATQLDREATRRGGATVIDPIPAQATAGNHRSDDGERRPAYRRQQWPDQRGTRHRRYCGPRRPPAGGVTKNSPPRPKLGGLRLHYEGLPATGCERGRTTG